MGEAKVKMEGTFAAQPATRGVKWSSGEGVSPCHWWGLAPPGIFLTYPSNGALWCNPEHDIQDSQE